MTEKQETKWCYSRDGERYHGQFNTEAEAHGEAHAELECDAIEGGEYEYWIAKVKPAWEYLNARWTGEEAADRIEECLTEEIGWDDRLVNLKPEDQEELGRLIIQFLRDKNAFQAYGVSDPVAHRHTVKETP